MAHNTDTRGIGASPQPPQTDLHVDRTAPRSGLGTMAFVLGGLVVAVLVLFFVFGRGESVTTPAPTAAPGGNNTTITVEPAAPAPAEPPVQLLEQPIPGVQTEPAPAPVPAD